LAVIERAILFGFQTLCLDTLDRCRFGWHERLLAVFRRMDMQSTGAGRSAPDRQPLDEGDGSSLRINDYRLFCSKPGDLLRVSNIAQ
jgi:hypothetical protein